jgi:hypothetical protein
MVIQTQPFLAIILKQEKMHKYLEKKKHLFTEEQIGDSQYELTLKDFDKAFDEIKKNVNFGHYIQINDLLEMNLSVGVNYILPIPKTRQGLWYIVCETKSLDKCHEIKVIKVGEKSLKEFLDPNKSVALRTKISLDHYL